jgi:hypothetical protein
MGILMAREMCTESQAFNRLRTASQQLNRKLRDIADDVKRTGQLPVRAPFPQADGLAPSQPISNREMSRREVRSERKPHDGKGAHERSHGSADVALQDRDDLSKTQQTRTRPSKTGQSEKH